MNALQFSANIFIVVFIVYVSMSVCAVQLNMEQLCEWTMDVSTGAYMYFDGLDRSSIFSLLRRLQDSENPLFVNYFLYLYTFEKSYVYILDHTTELLIACLFVIFLLF